MKKKKPVKYNAKSGKKPTPTPVTAKKVIKSVLVKHASQTAVKKTGGTHGKSVKSTSKVPPQKVASGSGVEALRQEITALRAQLSRHMAPVTTGSMEEVDALRRVLNDLMEARLNDVIRELVTIRNSATAAGSEARRIADQMDTLLADLGAMKFEAERFEHVDPLIHTVAREVTDPSLPDGIIMETLRPGFHTSRGIVVAKALVTVNRRS